MSPVPDLPDLISALGPLGMDGEQLAEMLWLAGQIRDGSEPDSSTDPAPHPDSGEPGRQEPPDPPESPRPDVEVTATAPMRRTSAAGGGSSASVLGLPRPPILELSRLLRELRPLSRQAPDPDRPVFDEPASVERTAATGVAWPVLRPGRVRNREVALVLDRHQSMAAWEGLATEVRALLESVGGFRRVAVWYLDETADGRVVVGTRARDRADRPISTLRDPTGRKIIMVLTCALGDCWSWGTAQAELAELAEASPVVIAQPLPTRLWRRTGLESEMGRLRSADPEGGPAPLRLVPSQAPAEALPIPVLQLAQNWLGPLAGLLTGSPAQARFPLALRSPIVPESARSTVASRQEAELGSDPEERIRRFRSASSPEAYRLAAYLSIPTLALPVMRLILRTATPRIDPSALAEVLCGGLLTATSDAAPYSESEDLREFTFPEPIRQLLRHAVRRSEARDILRATEEFLLDSYDVSTTLFRATLSTPSDTSGSHPFALIPLSRLLSIAPAFASVVDPEEWDNYDVVIGAANNALDPAAVDEALAALRRALSSLRQGNPVRDRVLRGMAELLSRRYAHSGELADLDEAIVVSKAALAASDDAMDRAEPLTALGRILTQRFEISGELDYLIDAVRVLWAAVSHVQGHDRRRPRVSEQLGDALLLLGEHTHDPGQLMNAVSQFHIAAEGSAGGARRGVVELKTAQGYLLMVRLAEYSHAYSAAGNAVTELRKAMRDASASPEFGAALDRVVELAADVAAPREVLADVTDAFQEAVLSRRLDAGVRTRVAAAVARLAEASGAPPGEAR